MNYGEWTFLDAFHLIVQIESFLFKKKYAFVLPLVMAIFLIYLDIYLYKLGKCPNKWKYSFITPARKNFNLVIGISPYIKNTNYILTIFLTYQ